MEEVVKKKTEGFIKSVKEIFGERLLSVIAYGSIVKDAYIKGKSDINILVITETLEMEDLMELKGKTAKRAVKNGLSPFFFSMDFMRSSADVFPLEWKEMQENHIILYGSDVIKESEIDKKDLLRQIEREIKQNYIDFQEGMIFNRNMYAALEESCRSLKVILRNMKEFCPEEAGKPGYFKKMENLSGFRKVKYSKSLLKEFAQEHLEFLKSLIAIADKAAGAQAKE